MRAFLVDRQDLEKTMWQDADRITPDDLAPGEVRLAHKCFAFTANNVTYARCGDSFGYWSYFPASPPWGAIPVWGLAEVIASRHGGIAEGETVYGFLPMSPELVVEPQRVKETGFVDGRAHRALLPRTYNEYVRVDRDPSYDKAVADQHLVLRPLFSLAFFLAHFLDDEAFFGAKNVVVTSASSKTAMALAFELRQLGTIRITGLTGPATARYLHSSGVYDAVLAYEDLEGLAACGPSLYVDIAGNETIRREVHKRLGGQLRYSCGVGATHAMPRAADAGLPGPEPEFFFTPKHILARRDSWGVDELRRRLARDWQAYLAQAGNSLVIEHSRGEEAIERIYAQVLAGTRAPGGADILDFD